MFRCFLFFLTDMLFVWKTSHLLGKSGDSLTVNIESSCYSLGPLTTRMRKSKVFYPSKATRWKFAKAVAWTVALAGSSSANGTICSAVWWRSPCTSVGPHRSSLLQKVMYISWRFSFSRYRCEFFFLKI